MRQSKTHPTNEAAAVSDLVHHSLFPPRPRPAVPLPPPQKPSPSLTFLGDGLNNPPSLPTRLLTRLPPGGPELPLVPDGALRFALPLLGAAAPPLAAAMAAWTAAGRLAAAAAAAVAALLGRPGVRGARGVLTVRAVTSRQ